jgi:hypothetical protein
MRTRFSFFLFALFLFSTIAASAAEQRVIVGIHENTPLMLHRFEQPALQRESQSTFSPTLQAKKAGTVHYLPGSYTPSVPSV